MSCPDGCSCQLCMVRLRSDSRVTAELMASARGWPLSSAEAQEAP